jgi:hypothetical protein
VKLDVFNGAGLSATTVTKKVYVDTTPPNISLVRVWDEANIERTSLQQDTDVYGSPAYLRPHPQTITCSWALFKEDDDTRIVGYRWAVSSSQSVPYHRMSDLHATWDAPYDDVMAWSDRTKSTVVAATNVTLAPLAPNVLYRCLVVAVNSAGLTSNITWSDGFTFDETHPINGTVIDFIRAPAVIVSIAFDFSSATSPGWSTGGGDPRHAFIRTEGRTPTSDTGPSAGVDGSGFYYYAEASHPRVQGDLFTLAYDGSACSDTGMSVSTVTFHYHMSGYAMGELRVINTAGEAVWSLRGDQGNAWIAVSVDVSSSSFTFEYTRGWDYAGDAAVAQVAVTCANYRLDYDYTPEDTFMTATWYGFDDTEYGVRHSGSARTGKIDLKHGWDSDGSVIDSLEELGVSHYEAGIGPCDEWQNVKLLPMDLNTSHSFGRTERSGSCTWESVTKDQVCRLPHNSTYCSVVRAQNTHGLWGPRIRSDGVRVCTAGPTGGTVSDGVSVLYGEELELDFTARGEAELSWDGPTSMARTGRASSVPQPPHSSPRGIQLALAAPHCESAKGAI